MQNKTSYDAPSAEQSDAEKYRLMQAAALLIVGGYKPLPDGSYIKGKASPARMRAAGMMLRRRKD